MVDAISKIKVSSFADYNLSHAREWKSGFA